MIPLRNVWFALVAGYAAVFTYRADQLPLLILGTAAFVICAYRATEK